MTKTRNLNHEPWKHLKGHLFKTPPLLIHASPDIVWQHVVDIENYNKYSLKTVTAHVEGFPQIGKKIILTLPSLGRFFQTSEETISIVDPNKKVIGWERQLPGNAVTERYHWLEETENGETLSHIALSIPGLSGFFSKAFRSKIEQAFLAINQGIKRAAESEVKPITRTNYSGSLNLRSSDST